MAAWELARKGAPAKTYGSQNGSLPCRSDAPSRVRQGAYKRTASESKALCTGPDTCQGGNRRRMSQGTRTRPNSTPGKNAIVSAARAETVAASRRRSLTTGHIVTDSHDCPFLKC